MTDNDIEDIQTVDIKVTAESIDAHVMCLKENGYKVEKSWIFMDEISFGILNGWIHHRSCTIMETVEIICTNNGQNQNGRSV